VLRLAVPLNQIQAATRQVHWTVFRASLCAGMVALLIALSFSRMFSRRIRALRTLAEGLLRSRLPDPARVEPNDELGELARALRGISEELHNTMDRLSLESTRRQAILASMLEGVLAVDGGMRIIFCNSSFARSVNMRLAPVDSMPLSHVVQDPALGELLTRVLSEGVPVRKKLTLDVAARRVFEVQAAPLEHRSSRGVIAMFHDITELERLERIRTDFVANVSHELRTPLAAIRGYAETLLDGGLEDPENNRKFVQIIQAQTVRLTSLSADLLVLAELEAPREATAPERLSVRESVKAAMSTVESEAQIRNVRMCGNGVEDLYIMGRRFGLEQTLVNLLNNAIKFNRPNGEVRVQARRDQGGNVCIAVTDNGIGIPAADLPRIFERFYCVDKARSRAVGGTGLGLSIVKHVVEKMNGTIAVESQPGKGSAFTLLFPPA
jgi:two-component system phosphate regulon sensor histidine kinase PhoR